MQQMVADLLALTRSRLGQGVPLELAEVDLVTIFQQAAAEIGAISRDHEVRISIEGDAKGLWDAGRLAQVVSNLLGNAVRHGKPGGVIEINIDGKDYENVWFSVSNEGQPIPVELLPSLFEPLVRSKQNVPGSVTGAGLGLGLFIAEQIVVSHNGDIKVESGNERTVFEVCLPRKVRVPRPVERPSTH
jgi:signal transduction histidine kinase